MAALVGQKISLQRIAVDPPSVQLGGKGQFVAGVRQSYNDMTITFNPMIWTDAKSW